MVIENKGMFGCCFLKLFWKIAFENSFLCFQKKIAFGN